VATDPRVESHLTTATTPTMITVERNWLGVKCDLTKVGTTITNSVVIVKYFLCCTERQYNFSTIQLGKVYNCLQSLEFIFLSQKHKKIHKKISETKWFTSKAVRASQTKL